MIILLVNIIVLLMKRRRLRSRVRELESGGRITDDLHDEIGSSLSSIHMLSQLARQQRKNEQRRDLLRKVSRNARETRVNMGDIAWMLDPRQSDAANLGDRMETCITYTCEGSGINCAFVGKEDLALLRMPVHRRRSFYLVFKEALNNAVRYSDTESLEVKVSHAHRQLQLQVQDHGKGFDVTSVVDGDGLSNMRRRAKELGGDLNVTSSPWSGTLVTLHVPI